MRIDRDTINEILVTLARNKSRSLLTAFGVFWGIFMLVSLAGGGNGLKDMINTQFEGFATNSCFLFAGQTDEAYKGFRKGRSWNMETADLTRLKSGVEGLDIVTPVSSWWDVDVTYGNNKYNSVAKGVYPEYQHVEEPDLMYGRYLNDVDIRDQRKVCVLGKRVYEALFEKDEDPCGKYICASGIYYRVVGVNAAEPNISINGSTSEVIMIPFTIFNTAYNQGKTIQVIAATLKPGYKMADVKPKIEQTIKAAHLISPTDSQALGIFDADAMFSMMDNVFLGLNILVIIVGAGTLLAGIIGVSNIMMVTVKERTVEIGIRRAIGAQPRDIMQQILSESVVLTLLSGTLGICAGVGFLQLVEGMTVSDAGHHYAFQMSFWMAIGALVLVVFLGMVAGLAPAYRAMAIKPVDAMRDE